jgi:hypothetical protein
MSDTPTTRRAEAQDALPDLDLIRDLTRGTRAMHTNAGRYIRKWSAEDPSVWAVRAVCEQLYEGYSRVLSASVGMVFAKPPQMQYEEAGAGVEEAFAPLVQNIDAAGTHLNVFAKSFAEVAMRDGYAIVLVDHPPTPPNATLADERALRLAPRWSIYERRSVMSWRVDTINNRQTVTQVVLHEPATVTDGAFGIRTVDRYRILRLVAGVASYAVVSDEGPKGLVVIEQGVFTDRSGAPFDVLPIGVAYTGRQEAPFVCRPPLMGVAYANLGHYQLSTALRFYRELCAYPQPVVTGQLQPVDTGAGLQPGARNLAAPRPVAIPKRDRI